MICMPIWCFVVLILFGIFGAVFGGWMIYWYIKEVNKNDN